MKSKRKKFSPGTFDGDLAYADTDENQLARELCLKVLKVFNPWNAVGEPESFDVFASRADDFDFIVAGFGSGSMLRQICAWHTNYVNVLNRSDIEIGFWNKRVGNRMYLNLWGLVLIGSVDKKLVFYPTKLIRWML